MKTSDKVKVLYILGAGRSGSTLLDRLLGQVRGFFSMGELKWIWRLVYGEEQLCGCGTPFKSCPFWTAAFRQAFGGPENLDARMEKLSTSLLRLRRLPQLLCPFLSRKYRDDLAYYSNVISGLCRAARDVSGCRVLIDSSKFNRDRIVLSRMEEIDLHVVHLIRDSRAVAYSWQRKKQRPEYASRTAYMYQLSTRNSASDWLFDNGMAEALRPFLKQYTRVHYEDLISDPRRTISRICIAVGEPNPALDFLDGQTAHLGKAHTVAGNPIRFKEGPIQLKPDIEWIEKLSKRDKALVTTITWPLMLCYGYFGRARTIGLRDGHRIQADGSCGKGVNSVMVSAHSAGDPTI